MRKFRVFTVVALVVLPTIFASTPGYSAAQLPWINTEAGPVQQPYCPSGNQFGCFGPSTPTGVYGSGMAGTVNTAAYAPNPFEPCLQFMQAFMRLAAAASAPR